MHLPWTCLVASAVLSASAIAKPVAINLGISGKLPPLTSVPIVQEYPAGTPCIDSGEALEPATGYGGAPVCYPPWFSASLSSELDDQFLKWTAVPNQAAIINGDSNVSPAAVTTINYKEPV
ncbi:hypothetical protein K7432_018534, partial [Basidiobolus ranarum]